MDLLVLPGKCFISTPEMETVNLNTDMTGYLTNLLKFALFKF